MSCQLICIDIYFSSFFVEPTSSLMCACVPDNTPCPGSTWHPRKVSVTLMMNFKHVHSQRECANTALAFLTQWTSSNPPRSKLVPAHGYACGCSPLCRSCRRARHKPSPSRLRSACPDATVTFGNLARAASSVISRTLRGLVF